MKYLKTFEAWGGKPLPITNLESLMNYVICDNCTAAYKVFNKSKLKCAYCQSENISLVDIDTYYDKIISNLDDQKKIDDILNIKRAEKEALINLVTMGTELDRN